VSIKRKKLGFERGKQTFEQPRAWARDKRISRKARGLLGELLSHSEGFEIKFKDLLTNGPEGKDALNTGLSELEDLGYLTRLRRRAVGGQFEVDYELSDPFEEPVDNFAAVSLGTSAENPHWAGFPTAGKSDALRRDTSLTGEEISPVTPTTSRGAVDNFGALRADDELSTPIRLSPPALIRKARAKKALDRDGLVRRVGPIFAPLPAGLRNDIIWLVALRILGRAAKAGTTLVDPTAYVAAAIELEPHVWLKVALQLDARPS
jgi:hypothetical protein